MSSHLGGSSGDLLRFQFLFSGMAGEKVGYFFESGRNQRTLRELS